MENKKDGYPQSEEVKQMSIQKKTSQNDLQFDNLLQNFLTRNVNKESEQRPPRSGWKWS